MKQSLVFQPDNNTTAASINSSISERIKMVAYCPIAKEQLLPIIHYVRINKYVYVNKISIDDLMAITLVKIRY